MIFFVNVIDDEGNGRRMGQHVGDRCATCANKGNLEMECRVKDEVPPSTTDLYSPMPPPFAIPFPSLYELDLVVLAFVQNHGPAEREYDKKGVIVEEMDKCTG